jgi:hypothetical protein
MELFKEFTSIHVLVIKESVWKSPSFYRNINVLICIMWKNAHCAQSFFATDGAKMGFFLYAIVWLTLTNPNISKGLVYLSVLIEAFIIFSENFKMHSDLISKQCRPWSKGIGCAGWLLVCIDCKLKVTSDIYRMSKAYRCRYCHYPFVEPLVAEGLTLRVEALKLQPPFKPCVNVRGN